MTKIDLWLPTFWTNALFNNDFSDLTEDEKYAFMDYMDGRYLVYGTFTPVAVDMKNSEKTVIHDAMAAVKECPIECVRVTFSVDHC